MGKFEDNQKVEQVKAILNQLQSIELQPEAGGVHVASDQIFHETSSTSDQHHKLYGKSDVSSSVMEGRYKSNFSLYLFSAAFSFLAFGVVIYVLVIQDKTAPDYQIPPKVETSSRENTVTQSIDTSQSTSQKPEFLLKAQSLLKKGQIIEARTLLLNAQTANPQNSEVVLLLARSYDPEFLKGVVSANAEPDLQEAKNWYRKWKAMPKK